MSITVGRYTFESPYLSPDNLEDRSGVYAIHCKRGTRVSAQILVGGWGMTAQNGGY